jgi:hypothetical protein
MYMAAMAQQFGLSRSTLFSLITIAATSVIFVTGATFALTTSDSTSGAVKSGTFNVAINVFGTGEAGALAFTTGNVNCPNSLQPGNFCTAQVSVQNTSTFPLILGLPTTSPVGTASTTDDADPGGCTDAQWPVAIDTTTNVYEENLPGGATTSFVVKVTLDSLAPLGCQNETATVNVSVAAST